MPFLLRGFELIVFSIIGSFLVAFAYMLLSLNFLKDQSKVFFYLLLIGNVSFIAYSVYNHDYPVLLLNIAFSFFAIMAILNKKIHLPWLNLKIFFISIFSTILLSIYFNKENLNWLMETIGWFSTIAGFGSYLLYSQKKINLFYYFFINMITNVTFSIYLYYNGNYPYMFLQMFLFFFSLYGIIRLSKFFLLRKIDNIK